LFMPDTAAPRLLKTSDAIREGLTEAARACRDVLFFAEGVDDASAVFGTLTGLDKAIDPRRLIEMPIAENGLCGIAIGAALLGKRSVISLNRAEFALPAMEQIVNNAAKAFYTSNGKHRVPLLLRLVVGRGWGQGPAHAQSLETMFAAVPGLKVIMPVFAEDAKGMMAAAIADDNPVISIENRWAHYIRGPVPEGYYTCPLDGPKLLRSGDALTVVASGYMAAEALRLADLLAEHGVALDVFDLRVLRPLRLADIIASARRTGRLLTVDTGFKILGMGSEIVAQVTEQAFSSLRAPPRRLGLPDHPTPSSRGLIVGYYPDGFAILQSVAAMLDLPQATVDRVHAALTDKLEGVGVDVPNRFFQGPF
jgi:acetoin:2,6-dichlorophenolindophenol oxidoreductase subunit beta